MNFNRLIDEPYWDEIDIEFNCMDGLHVRFVIDDLLKWADLTEVGIYYPKDKLKVSQSPLEVKKIMILHYLYKYLERLCPTDEVPGTAAPNIRAMLVIKPEFRTLISEFMNEVKPEHDLDRLFRIILSVYKRNQQPVFKEVDELRFLLEQLRTH